MHELLSVYDDQKGQATKTRTELAATFTNKPHLFRKKVQTFRPLAENAKDVVEIQADIQSSLSTEITWVGEFLARAMDSGYQIDLGNTHAKADLIVDGVALATNIPATFLLQLEKHLVNVRDLAITMPTLDPAQGFTLDSSAGKGIWKAREVIKNRTQKQKKVLQLSPSTDKHPAQVQAYEEDVVIGNILEQEWSALTTPAIKSQVIANCDKLIQATKQARSRANSVELTVEKQNIGKSLLDFIFKPLL